MQKHPATTVYKILSANLWNPEGRIVPPMPIDLSDGFIHLSTAEQLPETLALHFKGQSGISILAIRTADIEPDLRWEPSRGGQLFPHVYGQVPVSAVASALNVSVGKDGTCDLPMDSM